MREEERGELGQADGLQHTHIQAHTEQRREVAHLLHNAQALEKQGSDKVSGAGY